MYKRMLGRFAATIGIAVLLVSGHASAQSLNGVTITLQPSVIKRIIEEAVNEQIIAGKEDTVSWQDGAHVELSPAWAGTLQAVANLTITTPGPDMYIQLMISFTCDWQNPSIAVSSSEPTVEADYPIWLDVLTATLSEGVANLLAYVAEVSQALAGSINNKLKAELAEEIGSTNFDECPEITIGGDAAVILAFSKGAECSNGAERMAPCPRGAPGQGWREYCSNGRWEKKAGEPKDCDAEPPQRRP